MKRRFSLALALLYGGISQAAEFRLDGQTFTLPDGFTIERVAGPPLVDRPIVADFDEQGRLYVADSSGSNEPLKVQLAEEAASHRPAGGRGWRRQVTTGRRSSPTG